MFHLRWIVERKVCPFVVALTITVRRNVAQVIQVHVEHSRIEIGGQKLKEVGLR